MFVTVIALAILVAVDFMDCSLESTDRKFARNLHFVVVGGGKSRRSDLFTSIFKCNTYITGTVVLLASEIATRLPNMKTPFWKPVRVRTLDCPRSRFLCSLQNSSFECGLELKWNLRVWEDPCLEGRVPPRAKVLVDVVRSISCPYAVQLEITAVGQRRSRFELRFYIYVENGGQVRVFVEPLLPERPHPYIGTFLSAAIVPNMVLSRTTTSDQKFVGCVCVQTSKNVFDNRVRVKCSFLK